MIDKSEIRIFLKCEFFLDMQGQREHLNNNGAFCSNVVTQLTFSYSFAKFCSSNFHIACKLSGLL